MSLFHPIKLDCPSCGESVEFQAADSVNADRRPDLREAILDGTFQRETCEKCDTAFRLAPELNFLDAGRGQWIAAFPVERMGEWETIQASVRETFAKSYGEKNSSPVARELGEGLTIRLVFGWSALLEKLVAKENKIDDISLELTKMAMLRGMDNAPFADGTELRLVEIQDDEFQIAWINSISENLEGMIGVPRGIYDDIVADDADWTPLRNELNQGVFIDMLRLMIGTA